MLEVLPSKLAAAAKLKETAVLARSTLKFSEDIIESDNYPLCKHWIITPKLHETGLTENPPTVHMGVTAKKHAEVINFPSLTIRSYKP